jgi:hypothetical protein
MMPAACWPLQWIRAFKQVDVQVQDFRNQSLMTRIKFGTVVLTSSRFSNAIACSYVQFHSSACEFNVELLVQLLAVDNDPKNVDLKLDKTICGSKFIVQ